MKPLLSVVIPTKNRHYYLKFIVDYFNNIQSDKIELVIQDNSDINTNTEFVSFLNSINDKRVKYNYTNRSISVVENCDLAILNASGDYITMIGDDDIFSHHILTITNFLKLNDIDACLPLKASYRWPDVQPRLYKNKLSGRLQIRDFYCKVTKPKVSSIVKKVISLGGTDILNLPRLYHGIIKKEILDGVYKLTGSYSPGPSPDMSNAMAISNFIENYIVIDIPVIVSGHSAASTGGQGAHGKHYGEIAEIKHLPPETAKNWSPTVPFYWSGETIYAESVLQSLKRTNQFEILKDFNYEYLYAKCFVFDKQYKQRIEKVIKKSKENNTNVKKLLVRYYYYLIWGKRIFFHLNNYTTLFVPDFMKTKTTFIVKQNIREVIDYIDNQIEKNNYDIDILIKQQF